MTPLAQRILNDSTLRLPERKFHALSNINIPAELSKAHAFDLSDVREMIAPLGIRMSEQKRDGVLGHIREKRFAFLPAPTTWIEYAIPEPEHKGQRIGILLMDAEDLAWGALCVGGPSWFGGVAEIAVQMKSDNDTLELRSFKPHVDWVPQSWVDNCVRDVYPMLAMINTPRVIGRRQHAPHAGLERRLAASRGMIGRFPLQAWTEIVLKVTPPKADTAEHEVHFTGRRALHFCRAHLRVQNGQLVLVSAHWRGDPALGLKRSRYRLSH